MNLKAILNKISVKRRNELENCDVRSYFEIIDTARIWTKDKSDNEKRLLLTYLIDTILDDICAEKNFQSLISHISPLQRYAFPKEYCDENGNKNEIDLSNTIDVDLTSSRIFTSLWSRGKTANNLLNINNNDFTFDEDNHKSVYYTDIELCQVYKGFHSINAGRYLKKGVIKSSVFRMELLYPHCTTNGLYWYNAHNGDVASEVYDFRFAAVYTLARMRAGCRT